MTEALILAERFCRACYEAGDIEAAAACLAEGALVCGESGQARGSEEIMRFLRAEQSDAPASRRLAFRGESEESVTRDVTEAALDITITAGDCVSSRRLFCTAVAVNGGAKIRTLRIVPGDNARLAEENARMNDLLGNLSCGIAVCHIDRENKLSIMYLNDGYFALMEDERDALSARYDENIVSGIHPDDMEMVSGNLDDLARTRRGHDMTYRYVTSGGKLKWIHVKTTTVPRDDGTTTSYSAYTDLTERMATEQKLTAIMETVPCGVCLYRRDGETLIPMMLNGRFRDMLGERAAEPLLLTREIGAICDFEDDCEAAEEAAKKLLAGEKQATFEARRAGSDGRVHWLRHRLTAMTLPGAVEEMVFCAVERIDIEKELRRQYEMERGRPRLGENSLLAYALINLSADETVEYVYWDGASVPPEDRLSLADGFENADRLFVDEEEKRRYIDMHDVPALLEKFARGETELSMDYRRRIPGGDAIWVRNILRLLRAPDSSDVFLFEYRYDIDDEKNTEIMYRRMTERAYDFIARVSLDSRRYILRGRESGDFVIPSGRGEDADAMFRRLIDARVHAEDRETARRHTACAGIREDLKTSDFYEFNCRVTCADGAVRHKRLTEFYLDRQRELAIVTCEDVTALVKTEAHKNELLTGALETARKASHAKSRFLSRMSHELRTPMNAVIGLSSLIEEDAGDTSAVLDAARKIGVSAKYLLSLINDILEMSRLESGHDILREDAFDMTALLEEVNAAVCGEICRKAIDYRSNLTERPFGMYVGDKDKIRRILVHILDNAVKFTPEGGAIRLNVEQRSRGVERADVRLTVSDTGIGIDPAFLPHVFEPFTQETACFAPGEAGAGIGLAIAKNLARMMNGRISAQSVKGQGTTVTVDLALGVPRERKQSDARPVDLTGRRILIAEDHPINAEVVRRLLEKTGADTVVAVNGLEAVDVFRRSDEFFFDAVLMDIQMPVMDGLTAAKQIRGLNRADCALVPIIALTANTFAEDRERSLAFGMDAHIAKPIDPRALLGTLRDLMRPRGDRSTRGAK